MKNLGIFKSLLLLSLVGIFSCVNLFAQEAKPNRAGLTINKPVAELIDEFGRLSADDAGSRIDHILVRSSDSSKSIGYIFIYCGKICAAGEIEAHIRGIEVKLWTRKGVDRKRLVILNAGFRDSVSVELWVVPEGACPPVPRSTVQFRDVSFTGKNKRFIEPYDCCDDPNYYWKQMRKKSR